MKEIEGSPEIIGKVRIAERKSREYKDEQGYQYIWHRYNREKERIETGTDEKVVNVTLDVWEADRFDSSEDHFLFLTEEMITGDTFSKGDQKIKVIGPGKYGGPLSKYVDDWSALFEYGHTDRSSDADNWKQLVREELNKYHERTGQTVVTRQELLDQSLSRFETEFPDAKTPEQTLSRELQELRDLGEIEFVEPGVYRMLAVSPTGTNGDQYPPEELIPMRAFLIFRNRSVQRLRSVVSSGTLLSFAK